MLLFGGVTPLHYGIFPGSNTWMAEMDLAAFGSQVPTISCWEKRKTGLIEIEMQIHVLYINE